MEKKVRMADIAQKLGISVVSVSKALSGKDGVSDEMRKKICALAKEMGYVPLRSKPNHEEKVIYGNIGILVADNFFADNTFYAGLYRQVSLNCNAHGFSALLEIVSAASEHNCIEPAMITRNKVDGLIFMGEIRRDYLRTVTKSGLPYMLLDFYDEDLDVGCVTSDNLSGGYHLTQHILQSGRKEIGFVGSIYATSSIMDRFLGYTKALLKEGIPVRSDWVLEDRGSNGLLRPAQLPQQLPKAFVCSCDEVAHNLVDQLTRLGYRVPEDVAVAGYDDYQMSQFTQPQLTTYRVNVSEMGRIVVEQLVAMIQGKPHFVGKTVVKGRLIARESA